MQYSEKIRGQVASVGNAAGTGARIALLNNESREEIETVVRKIEKIETAVETKFQEYFVNAMAIPHRTDIFPNLEDVVSLPEVDKDSRRTTSPQRRKRTAKA